MKQEGNVNDLAAALSTGTKAKTPTATYFGHVYVGLSVEFSSDDELECRKLTLF